MRARKKTELCIFDLDGTLLDTIDDIANSLNRVLNASNFNGFDVDWYKKHVGRGARNLVLDALPSDHGLNDDGISGLVMSYKEDYRRNSMVFTKPYDGIHDVLRKLTAMSVKIAVITNKPQESTETLLREFFGDIDFVSVYGEKPDRPIKPDVFAAHEVLSLTGLLPEQVVHIGDAEVDMIFAENASIFSIGVLWGFRPRSILEQHGAKAIIEHPKDILGCLI